MVRFFLILVLCCAFRSVASAAELRVSVTAGSDEAVGNAVISVKPLSPNLEMPEPVNAAVMAQQNTMFAPFVLAVAVGTEVTFPNMDEFRHQVYSFSKPKRFELRLYGQDTTNKIMFDKPGVVALGCNIHDNMLAFIYVSEHPVVGKTDESGDVVFSNLPPGGYEVHVWHPDELRGGDDMKMVTLRADEASDIAFSVKLRPVRRQQQPPADEGY
ncbi:carboxypeptidase regulatory-like domain-containing protein [Kordiimonas aestuarii]|uniref:carboxypeptidase regulatory-like domain-containing protein n=1 Tax=Kordiimonas aestuarii TaxID=1005925 RepID=UPI0021D21262|nr:carboxypeptidase regulatory-like domain-containing protein [Kordiimonas aestuarii]